MTIRLQVSNFRRIERATIEVSPIALIAGTNEQGKTCLAQAARGALLREGAPHPNAKKKDGDLMVRRGAKTGEVILSGEDGTVTLSFPKGKVAESGDAPPRATVYAAGAASLCDLPTRTAADFQGYIDAAPTKADLAVAMSGIGYAEKAIDYTWDEIAKHGWDAVMKTGKESATRTKGQWEQITGEKWGEKKAEGWEPAHAVLAEWNEGVLAERVTEAEAAFESAVGASAVSQAERERLEKAATDRPTDSEIGGAETHLAALEAEVEKARMDRLALPPARNDEAIPCPSCGTLLNVDTAWSETRPALKEAETIDEAEMKKRRLAIAEADGKVSRTKGECDVHRNVMQKLNDAKRAAEAAAKQLADLGEPTESGGNVEEARAALYAAQADLAAFKAKHEAAALHEKIVRTLALCDLLAPDGLRKDKLAKGIGPFNGHLAELCEMAGWRRVWVDESLDIHMDQDPYWLLSESAQYRTRVVLQIAMALADQSAMVVIDAADILDAQGRNGLFRLLQACSVPALVTMTASAPDKVPDLAVAGLGVTMWLQDGVAAPLTQAEAAE